VVVAKVWQVIGQDSTTSYLQHCLETGGLAHAYLLAGPAHVGKTTLALNLAQALNCDGAVPPCGECPSCRRIASLNHADVQIIRLVSNGDSERQRTEIGIDQIRQLQHTASLPPFEGRHKVFIMEEAALLSTEAANCLLKTLEEPADRVIFLLLTASEGQLLPTVVSRCQRLELLPVPLSQAQSLLESRWGVDTEKARLLAGLSHGCLGWALAALKDSSVLEQREAELERLNAVIDGGIEDRLAQSAQLAAQFGRSREQIYGILDLWLDYWRDLLLVRIGCSDIIVNGDRLAGLEKRADGYTLEQISSYIRSIQAAKEQLMLNANPQLALDVLMLDTPGKESGGRR
jgi:DNA polymerase-3 subunit delta'